MGKLCMESHINIGSPRMDNIFTQQ
eukprot:SAG31_NODE_20198_length_581_cov_1.012448_1_plen_24_part_10